MDPIGDMGKKVLLEVEEFLVKTMLRNNQVFLFLCDRFIQVKIYIFCLSFHGVVG